MGNHKSARDALAERVAELEREVAYFRRLLLIVVALAADAESARADL